MEKDKREKFINKCVSEFRRANKRGSWKPPHHFIWEVARKMAIPVVSVGRYDAKKWKKKWADICDNSQEAFGPFLDSMATYKIPVVIKGEPNVIQFVWDEDEDELVLKGMG